MASLDDLSKVISRNSVWIEVREPAWIIDDQGLTKGNRVKCVVTPTELVTDLPGSTKEFFWKQSIARYPLEFWSEILAYQIAPFCKVGVPVTYPSWLVMQNRPGVFQAGSLTRFLIRRDLGDSLIHGGDWLSFFKPDFERKKGSDHSVQLCQRALTFDLFKVLFGQFVFDALIGNSDRHQDNWAFSLSRKYEEQLQITPAFDNGSSLGRELDEATIASMLSDANRLDAYITRGTPHVRWDTGMGLERLNHEELIRRILSLDSNLRSKFDSVIAFSERHVAESISRVAALSRAQNLEPNIEISPAREEFLIKVILRRRERLSLI